MSVVIRMARAGRKKLPFYHIVAADKRRARDGRYIEKLGHFNPLEKGAKPVWNTERVNHWLNTGAQPSDRVAKFVLAEGLGSEKLRSKIQKVHERSVALQKKRDADAKAAKEAEEKAAAAEAAAEAAEAAAAETPAEEAEAAPAEEAPAEEPKAE